MHSLGIQITEGHNADRLVGKAMQKAEMCLIVPIIYYTNDKDKTIYFKLIIYSFFSALAIVSAKLILRFCKVKSRIWSSFYVLALLFGITVYKKPQK